MKNSDNIISDQNSTDSPGFIQACRDYFYLLNHSYPERGILKLIGDRYRLSGVQRTVIYRGISSAERSLFRAGLLIDDPGDTSLVIDGYNVLFTLMNYRLGRKVFISTDRVVRDAGSLHGKIRDMTFFNESIELMLHFIKERVASQVVIYLDNPVSHSERHKMHINELIKKKNITGECSLAYSADFMIKQHNNCVVATSDTVIIEKSGNKVCDLPALILKNFFNAKITDIVQLAGLEIKEAL